MLVFEEREKLEYPEKNLAVHNREPTNSTHIWRRVWESNPGHIIFGGRRVLSPLRHPWFPFYLHSRQRYVRRLGVKFTSGLAINLKHLVNIVLRHSNVLVLLGIAFKVNSPTLPGSTNLSKAPQIQLQRPKEEARWLCSKILRCLQVWESW